MKPASDVLKEFPEWQNDWQSHALFCAYDQDSSEEFVLAFWRRAIHKLFEDCIKGLSIEIEELKVMTHRNGRYPTGLKEILQELITRNEFTTPEKISQELLDQESSHYWGYWLKKAIIGLPKQDLPLSLLVDPQKLSTYSSQILKLCKSKERNIFSQSELSHYLNLSDQDLAILLNHLKLSNQAVLFTHIKEKSQINLIKFKQDQENLEIKPEDSAIVQLNITMQDIDKKVEELNENISEVHKKILEELKMQNRNHAKFLLMRKKMIQKKVEDLMGSRLNIEQQLLCIRNSLTNKEIMMTLKSSNEVIRNIMPDIEQVNKVLDSAKENFDLIDETNSAFAFQEQDDELLAQFESLNLDESREVEPLPSVPKKKIVESAKGIQPSEVDLEAEFDQLDIGPVLIS